MDAYIYKADLYCEDCAEKIWEDLEVGKLDDLNPKFNGDNAIYPSGPYPNGGGEADTPQHCGSCGLFLENPLTEEGKLYVNEAVDSYLNSKSGDAEIINQWVSFYDYLDLANV